MHILFVIFGISVAAPLPTAQSATPAPEPKTTVWVCRSRIGGFLPILGRLYHTSVLFCPAGVCPVVMGPDGRPINNPACACFGTHPRSDTFLRETKPRIDPRCQSVHVPACEVRARIASHGRRWRLWYNCQHAAADATGHGCCPADQPNWFRRVLGWLGFPSPGCCGSR